MVVSRGLRSISVDLLDAVFRPSTFVESRTSTYSFSLVDQVDQVVGLVVVYAINLSMYAIPLTLAGFGVESSGAPPQFFLEVASPVVSAPITLWQVVFAFVQNSAFITAAVVATLLTYHVGVLFTFDSRGLVQSLHTVVYSASVYLVGLFSAVWYLTTNPGVESARTFVRQVQAAFVYELIDLFGTDLRLSVGRPETIEVGRFSSGGTLVLTAIVLLLGYYLYSLYLGSRINHQMGRVDAVVALLAVATAPIVYVAASVIVATTTVP